MNHVFQSPIPRALSPGFCIRAQQGPDQIFNEIRQGLEGFKAEHNERLDNMEAALNTVGARVPDVSANFGLPVDREYSQTFASYFRTGGGDDILRAANATGQRATIQAAMSVGDNSSGGYLAPVEWDRQISEAQRATSPMRRLATVIPTSVGAYTTLYNTDLFGSGWVGEVAARPQTTTASLAPITFAAGEIYAMPAATQRLLDDGQVPVERWLVQSIEKEFNRQEGIAFLSGSGVNKPAGFLTFAEGGINAASHPGGAIDVTEAAITVDSLIDLMYGLASPYRQGATWVVSSLTAAFLTKLKDSDGNLIWRESLIVGQPATLLGRPVEIDEGMPGPVAGALAVAFGDFKAGYCINDRLGTRILRDPFSAKPYVLFYITKRVGGGVLDPNAIRLLKLPV